MAINPLGSAGLAHVTGPASTPKTESFSKALKQAPLRGENSPIPVTDGAKPEQLQRAKAGQCRVEASSKPEAQVTTSRVLDQVTQAQGRMEQILKLAESGKSFSPAELLSLQTHVYRASQELDLAGKVVEKATGGVKQVLQTQV